MGETSFAFISPLWSSVGLIVYSIFLLIFLILVGIFIFLALKPYILGYSKKEAWHQLVIVVCIAGIVASLLVPNFFECTTLKISNDGSWILTNGWGITLTKISKNIPRRVVYDDTVVSWYGGLHTSDKLGRMYLVTDKKIYPSWVSTNPEEMKRIFGTLDEMIQVQQIAVSQNTTIPISIYKYLQYVRYVFWLTFVLLIMVYVMRLRSEKKIIESE